MKIYTKTGDKGETSLFGGTRVLKSSLRVDTYGTVDELNSVLGVVVAFLPGQKKVRTELLKIQSDLFLLGAALANPKKTAPLSLVSRVESFEDVVDELTEALPVLRNFILPGGGEAGAYLHVARTLCRRAERRLVELNTREGVDGVIIRYFNRLSDLLFTMARFVNHKQHKKETIWKAENT